MFMVVIAITVAVITRYLWVLSKAREHMKHYILRFLLGKTPVPVAA